MTDTQVMQDLFDTFEVTNKLNAIVNVEDFLAARHALLDLGPKADTSPAHVQSCCKTLLSGIGPRLFRSFITLENVAPGEGLDDVWAYCFRFQMEWNCISSPIQPAAFRSGAMARRPCSSASRRTNMATTSSASVTAEGAIYSRSSDAVCFPDLETVDAR